VTADELERLRSLECENIALRAMVRIFQGLATDAQATTARLLAWRDETQSRLVPRTYLAAPDVVDRRP
jgi:hypothetical protein